MKHAVIVTGGKQYRVAEGDVIYVEKLGAEVDEEVTFDKVIAVCNKTLKVGKPYVKDAFVKGTVVKNGKGKKANFKRDVINQPRYKKIELSKDGLAFPSSDEP